MAATAVRPSSVAGRNPPRRAAVKNSAPARARMANTRIMVQAGPKWNRISASGGDGQAHRHRGGDVAPGRRRGLGGMARTRGWRIARASASRAPPWRATGRTRGPGRGHRTRATHPTVRWAGRAGEPARWRCGWDRRRSRGRARWADRTGGPRGPRRSGTPGRWVDRWCRARRSVSPSSWSPIRPATPESSPSSQSVVWSRHRGPWSAEGGPAGVVVGVVVHPDDDPGHLTGARFGPVRELDRPADGQRDEPGLGIVAPTRAGWASGIIGAAGLDRGHPGRTMRLGSAESARGKRRLGRGPPGGSGRSPYRGSSLARRLTARPVSTTSAASSGLIRRTPSEGSAVAGVSSWSLVAGIVSHQPSKSSCSLAANAWSMSAS